MRERGPIGPRGAIPARLPAPWLLFATVGAALLQVLLRAYVTDDTFIHCVFAREVATQGNFGFNAGHAVYGDTSPLWVFLLAGAHRLGLDPLATAKVLSASAAILLPVVVGSWCVRLGLPAAAAAAAMMIVALDASIARWGASGMETVLGALVLVTACALMQGGRARPGRELVVGLLLGAATLLRPEAMLLLALALAAAAWASLTGGMTLGAAMARAAGALAPVTAWGVYAWRSFGTLTPTTAAAKSSGLIGDAAQVWGDVVREGRVLVATEVVAVLACLVCLVWPRGLRRWLDGYVNTSLALALVWAGGVLAAYALLGYEIVSRYLVPVLPVLVVLGVSAVCALIARPAMLARALAAVAVLSIAESAVITVRYTAPQVESFTRGMESALIPAALWFRDHTPEGSVIAVQDIGAVGYYAQRPVLDLGGLVTPEIMPLRRRMSDEDIVTRGAFVSVGMPQYLLVRGPGSDSLGGRMLGGAPVTRLFAVQMPNLGVTRPAPVLYTAYQLGRTATSPALAP